MLLQNLQSLRLRLERVGSKQSHPQLSVSLASANLLLASRACSENLVSALHQRRNQLVVALARSRQAGQLHLHQPPPKVGMQNLRSLPAAALVPSLKVDQLLLPLQLRRVVEILNLPGHQEEL
jgi:hypothetical protein